MAHLRRAAGVVFTLLWLTACGGRPSEPTEPEGFGSAALKAAGITGADLTSAWILAQNNMISGCMSDAGYQIKTGDLVDALKLVEGIGRVTSFGGVVHQMAAQLSDGTVTQSGLISISTAPLDENRLKRLTECRERARVEVVNPIAPFYEWLDRYSAEVNSVAEADPLVSEARREFTLCINEMGYNVEDEYELANSFVERANDLIDRGNALSMPAEQIAMSLGPLSEEEDSIAAGVNFCVSRRDRTVDEVTNAAEFELMRSNAAVFAEQFEVMRVRVNALLSATNTIITNP